MANIHNAQLVQSIIDKAKLQIATDRVPTQLAEKVVPVMEVAPVRLIRSAHATASDTASAVVITTSAEKDTFLVGFNLSTAKDVVSDSLHSAVEATIEGGASTTIFRMRYEPITAGQFTENVMFIFPLKLAKNTAITVYNNTGTASIDTTLLVYFYEVE